MDQVLDMVMSICSVVRTDLWCVYRPEIVLRYSLYACLVMSLCRCLLKIEPEQ